ncbi:MAG TPA: glycosyltransferase [Trebonia sp.]|nr:glycosyltransferase [Trebonia sp.]
MLELGIACILSAAAWVYLLFFHGSYWRTGQRLPPARGVPHAADPAGDSGWPAVVAVVPARNEADMLPVTLPALLSQDYPGEFRVTLVNDGSTDHTGAIAAALAAGPGRVPLTVVSGRPRPEGWAGKVWAMEQGVQAAAPLDGYVLFTDADIEWEPGALRSLVAAAEGDDRALVSQMALLRAQTGWERIVVPAFVYFFAQLYPFRLVNAPRSRVAAAAGGCMLIRHSALAKAGGLEKIKGALIDDVALGTLLKRDGHRCWLGLTTDIRSIRPYPRLADLWQMIARSAYVQLRYSPLLLAGTILGLLLLYAAPPAGLLAWLIATLAGHQSFTLAGAAGLAGWLLMARSYLPMLLFYRLSLLRAPTLPLIAIMYAAMTADSARRHYCGRAVSWRGRPAQQT